MTTVRRPTCAQSGLRPDRRGATLFSDMQQRRHDLQPPRHVSGALVFSYVGEDPPADIGDWRYQAILSKTTALDHVPPVAGGRHQSLD
jgi:hypothetical protein